VGARPRGGDRSVEQPHHFLEVSVELKEFLSYNTDSPIGGMVGSGIKVTRPLDLEDVR